MLIKTRPVELKALPDDEGVFEALVAVFGNKDLHGDVITPGAFADTLAEWSQKSAPIPIYWSHRMDDPDYNIGYVLEAKETDEGLWIKGQLDFEAGKGSQVHRLLKGKRVTQFSFAYDVVDGGWRESDELGDYYELRKLALHEVGPTPLGANPETELLAVKSAAERVRDTFKAGQLPATHIDSLRKAQVAIADVLDAVDSEAEASGQDDIDEEVGQESDNSQGAVVNPSVDALAVEIELLESEVLT